MSSRLPGLLPILLALAIGAVVAANAQDTRPNIVLIMTDDQGSAQLGSHGDPLLRTPHLDRLAAESVEMTRFYVSPVRAPTRAALLTGRYNYRTGVVDTYIGRAMMEPGEVTIAEMLRDAGYRTGIFGKWHLGDAPEPYRAFAAVEQRYKLVQALSFSQPAPPDAPLELYDLVEDPGETTDIAARRPYIVERQPQRGMLRAPCTNRAGRLVLGLDKHERRPPGVERDRQLVGEVPILRADRTLVESARQHVLGDPRPG